MIILGVILIHNVVWRDVIGYEGLYRVSNTGEIYSIRINKILKKSDNGRGYHIVCLSKDKKNKIHMVHRLVAFAFIPNNDKSKNEINHINEIKTDNYVENLEWCTRKENNNYGSRSSKQARKMCKEVLKYSLDDELLNEYLSVKEASEINNFNKYSIASACRGDLNTYKGFKWKYKKDIS